KMPNEHIFPAIPHIHLTPRELDVLKGVVEGMSNKEIAHALGMTIRTVKFHLDNIFSKLGVASRTAAALFAVQHGLLS
ncbi:MAG TPA: response regulator transcription factor, partial [Aggregatilineales bacterium]|nr:response regulator transcription factor [Aggregatilineales bacterium]